MSDLWQYLQNIQKPIVMYGMGNGADKILSVLAQKNILVRDFFASDGFVRGHSFHGKRVLSYAEIEQKYDDFVVLLAFATSRPEVMDNIRRIASRHELYAPDVPVTGDQLFDEQFCEAHQEDFEKVRELLADERSRIVFDLVMEYKCTGNLSPLFASECDPCEPIRDILHPQYYQTVCDLGAYTGDTAQSILSVCSKIQRLYALEPDKKNFKKLCAYAETDSRITALNLGAWECEKELPFASQGNRNSGIGGNGTARFDALDNLVHEKVDYIKYDVEGSEREAILGAKEIIQRDRPEMLVSVYHRSKDLFSLPLLIHSLRPDYRFYLRRFPYIPAWDLNLYCV